MELNIHDYDFPPDMERAFTLSMVIRSFKGRKNVEVHLFRPEWDEGDDSILAWDSLIGSETIPNLPPDIEKSKKVILESFTQSERDRILEFLKATYSDRLESIDSAPMDLPLPLGLPPLGEVPEGKNIGIIRFSKIPSYSLPFPLCGLYDLSQHDPIIEAKE